MRVRKVHVVWAVFKCGDIQCDQTAGREKTPNTPCDTLDVPDESQKISFNSVSKSLLWFKFTYIERGRQGGWLTNGACVHVCLLNLTSRLFFISILNTEYAHKYYSHVFFLYMSWWDLLTFKSYLICERHHCWFSHLEFINVSKKPVCEVRILLKGFLESV